MDCMTNSMNEYDLSLAMSSMWDYLQSVTTDREKREGTDIHRYCVVLKGGL